MTTTSAQRTSAAKRMVRGGTWHTLALVKTLVVSDEMLLRATQLESSTHDFRTLSGGEILQVALQQFATWIGRRLPPEYINKRVHVYGTSSVGQEAAVEVFPPAVHSSSTALLVRTRQPCVLQRVLRPQVRRMSMR